MHRRMAFILVSACCLPAQPPVNLSDSVLVAYYLTPQQEAQFSRTDSVMSPFWSDWGGKDEIRITPPDNCWPGKCGFADSTDAGMLVRAAATERGVYLYAEIEDDAWVDGGDYGGEQVDLAVLMTDLLSSDSIWACTDCWVGLYDGRLTYYTHEYDVFMGRLAPECRMYLQYEGWGAWERAAMTFEQAEGPGYQAELVELSTSRRAVELFIPWELYWFWPEEPFGVPGIVAGTPLAGRRFGFAAGYNDGDSLRDTVDVLRWLGKDPWTSDNYTVNYWADLLMADNMPPAGFYAGRAIVVEIYPHAGAPDSLGNPSYPPVSTRTMHHVQCLTSGIGVVSPRSSRSAPQKPLAA